MFASCVSQVALLGVRPQQLGSGAAPPPRPVALRVAPKTQAGRSRSPSRERCKLRGWVSLGTLARLLSSGECVLLSAHYTTAGGAPVHTAVVLYPFSSQRWSEKAIRTGPTLVDVN